MKAGGWSDIYTMRKIYTKVSDLDITTQGERYEAFFGKLEQKTGTQTENAYSHNGFIASWVGFESHLSHHLKTAQNRNSERFSFVSLETPNISDAVFKNRFSIKTTLFQFQDAKLERKLE
jgi:hypothetical protein